MAPLLFICPKTNQQAPTGIETDVQSLSAAWKATLKVNCPCCGEVHEPPLEGGFRYQNYEQATRRCPRHCHRETDRKLAHGAARQVAPPYRGPIIAYLGCTFGSPPGVPGGGMTLR